MTMMMMMTDDADDDEMMMEQVQIMRTLLLRDNQFVSGPAAGVAQ